MPLRISAAGVSTISDHRKTRLDWLRRVYCTSLRLSGSLRQNFRTCLTHLSFITFYPEECRPLTSISSFQLEVCRAKTELSTLSDITNRIATRDVLNILIFNTSHVCVDRPIYRDFLRDEARQARGCRRCSADR